MGWARSGDDSISSFVFSLRLLPDLGWADSPLVIRPQVISPAIEE
jgi:hypothetical protein